MENECLFCELNRFNINKELLLPERKSIIWEDENVYASPDLFPLRSFFGSFKISL